MRTIVCWGHTAWGCTNPGHSRAEWDELIARSGFRCFYCADLVNLRNERTKDHLIPLIHNGCNCIGNLVLSCLRCNGMKKEKTIYEFLRMKPALVETTGRFYTRITSLNSLTSVANDPLLNAVRRLAEKKRFPEPTFPPEKFQPSWAWRFPA